MPLCFDEVSAGEKPGEVSDNAREYVGLCLCAESLDGAVKNPPLKQERHQIGEQEGKCRHGQIAVISK
jgi:hypothetical protein